MFKSRQQYNHTQRKLKDLIRMGMVTFNPASKRYFKTIKGEQYSQIYRMLQLNLRDEEP